MFGEQPVIEGLTGCDQYRTRQSRFFDNMGHVFRHDENGAVALTDALEVLGSLFAKEGARQYLGEAVSISTHMLQAAALAEAAGAPDHLIAAALLHDVGHLRHEHAPHEHSGAEWLAQWFSSCVIEPVRLHAAAKRYLCAVEAGYLEKLSPASLESLHVQGGPMSPEESRSFAELSYAKDAIAVRRWDEAAKDPAAPGPEFDHFRPLLERLAQR